MMKTTVKKQDLGIDHTLQNSQYQVQQYLSLLENSCVLSTTDKEGIITHVSEVFCQVSGYTKKELVGKKHNILGKNENHKEIYKTLWHTIKTKKESWQGILKNKTKQGKTYYSNTTITPIKDLNEEIIEYIAISDNLNILTDDKSHLFEKIEENDFSILIQLQIDEFDMLEKFYSTITVDQVEKNFSYNLLSYLPKEYTFKNIYALGVGRFALLTNFQSFENTQLNIEDYLNKFVTNVKNSILRFDEMEFDLNITVSYAMGKYMIFEDSRAGLENALEKKLKVCFANDSSIIVSQEAKKSLEMIQTVKIALKNYNIISYFQPIINNKTKEIDKYESLVRLIDENNNVISPIEFLNISKKGDYYNTITERVLENSFKILHSVNTKVSINLSASDLEKETTRKKIITLLDEYITDNHRIIFELLEDEHITNMVDIQAFIKTIKKRGVKIAIDDFGSGYSNFERVFAFEPDILKIDGSLIKNIETDQFNKHLVETIVLFAKKQNIETIAEYVENESIFNLLQSLGVDYSQGYYFGKPTHFDTQLIK